VGALLVNFRFSFSFDFISLTPYFLLAQFALLTSDLRKDFIFYLKEGHFLFFSPLKTPASPPCANGVARAYLGYKYAS